MKKIMFSMVALSTLLAACSTVEKAFDKTSESVEKASTALLGKTMTYQCADNQILTVHTYEKGHSQLLDLTLPNKERHTLARVVSASGEKYQGDVYEWWEKGETAYFTSAFDGPKDGVECRKVAKS